MLLANVILIGVLVAIACLAASPWLLPILLVVLLGIQVGAYRVLLAPASRLLEERRESLVEAVQATT